MTNALMLVDPCGTTWRWAAVLALFCMGAMFCVVAFLFTADLDDDQ